MRHAAAMSLCALVVLASASRAHGQGAGLRRPAVVPRRLLFVVDQASNLPLKEPTGVWYDAARGEILVADTGNHRVVILDEGGRVKGEFIHKVRSRGSAGSVLGEPRRLAVNGSGEILVVDSLCDYVDVCDYRGRSIRQMRLSMPGSVTARVSPADAPVALDGDPVAIAVDYRDNVYIASATRIHVFDARGEFVRAVGVEGTGPGRFSSITSIWVDTAGRIYVTDARSLGVQTLGPEGQVLLAFGEHNSGFLNFSLPVSVVTDRRGHIWVADALRHIVSAFRREGGKATFLDYIGAFGERPGQFAYPSGLAAGGDGRLIVVDRVGARVQCFEF